MHRDIPLQETMDDFVKHVGSGRRAQDASACLEALAGYLAHFSDLFGEHEPVEEELGEEWERELEEQMVRLLEGDLEPVSDLGNLPLARLDPEHIRDFLGWFALRETGDAATIRTWSRVLRAWFAHNVRRGWWSQADALAFRAVLDQVAPEAVRAARLAQALFHFVRAGIGGAPGHRGRRFSRFVEGHGRVSRLTDEGIWFRFDNAAAASGEEPGPVRLPKPLLALAREGDVFDVELGLRGGEWQIVDLGPVYPGCVYVEAEAFEGLDKRA